MKQMFLLLTLVILFVQTSTGATLTNAKSNSDHIHFISIWKLKNPIKRIIYPNGNCVYFGFYHGSYHALPTELAVTHNGQTNKYKLEGSLPPLKLSASNGHSYKIRFARQPDGQDAYYADIDGAYAEIPLKSHSPGVEFFSATTVPYPIKKTLVNGNAQYSAYSNGKYKTIPSKFTVNLDGKVNSFSIAGHSPYIVLKDHNGISYPLTYSLGNNQFSYYLHKQGSYILIPINRIKAEAITKPTTKASTTTTTTPTPFQQYNTQMKGNPFEFSQYNTYPADTFQIPAASPIEPQVAPPVTLLSTSAQQTPPAAKANKSFHIVFGPPPPPNPEYDFESEPPPVFSVTIPDYD